MDFFSEQDRARRSSKLLVLLFVLAVLAVIGLVYVIVLVMAAYDPLGSRPIVWWDPRALLWTSLSVSALIGGGSMYKIARLARNGGVSIALSLGGEPVSRDTTDHLGRRLLNVVDEMSIASGVPVPQVYVLSGESGINAFAAGHDFNDAVIAVTRGALEQLSRDELQGVVAHEFSHILHGDMRLNLRLVGLLHGILLLTLIGRYVMQGGARGRSRNSGSIALLGLAFVIAGYLGVFLGRLIKAAVSRQREFLADASAVQYTRNPGGIGGALKKIAGLGAGITHPAAEEASHMFFGHGGGFSFGPWFATHPPMEERIARIDPAYRALAARGAGGGETARDGLAMGFSGPVPVTPTGVLGSIGNVDARHVAHAARVIGRLSPEMRAALNHPDSAAGVLYGLLAASQTAPEALLDSVLDDPGEVAGALGYALWLNEAGRELWLPVVELAMPALQTLDTAALAQVMDRLEALVRADRRLSLFEFAVTSVLHHALGEERPGRHARHVGMDSIRDAVTLLLSVLVHGGHASGDDARFAFAKAAGAVPLDGPLTLLDRDELSLSELESALALLGGLKFRFKRTLIEACVAAIEVDGEVTLAEAELLRAFGARLDCPVPPILPGAVNQARTSGPEGSPGMGLPQEFH